VQAACQKVRARLLHLARKIDGSPLAGAGPDDVSFADGKIRLRSDPSCAVSLIDALRHGKLDAIEEEAFEAPRPNRKRYSCHAHSAVFAEVKVDSDLGSIRVSRVVTAVAGGRILNPKTAGSQILGGIVWGIGMALEEESVIDQAFGRFMNHNFAEYHVP